MQYHASSLSSRILIGATAAVAMALLFAGSYFAIGERDSVERVFDKQNQTLSDTLAAFSIEQLISLDFPSLENALLIAGKKNDNIRYIEVSQEGRVVATFGTPDAIGRTFVSEAMTRETGGHVIGKIKIVASTRDHDELQERRLIQNIITLLLIFTTMGFSLRWLLLRSVIRPIQALTTRTDEAIANALPELDSTENHSHEKIDEIKLLERRFLALLDGLKRRDIARTQAEQALLDHQNNLEKLVEQRTHDLHLAQQEALRLNKVKSEFLAAASHDLRQPIQALNLFHSALANAQLNEEQTKLNQFIGKSLHSLGEILNTLLDITKIDAGMIIANPKPILSSELFERIEAEFAPMALDRKLRFKLYFPLREMTLFTDPELLFSLLRNLIDNAIKYTEKGGILVSVRRRKKQALIQVWDTGIGISREKQHEIFEEYVQLGNPERDNRKGLGLGLSIVSRLARLLHCEVNCQSKSGRGTLFEFTLPLAVDRIRSTKTMATPEEIFEHQKQLLNGKHIVVIEDDPLVAKAIALSLSSVGLQVTSCMNAEEALANPAITSAEFYISDFRLPGKLHGLELLAEIEKRCAHPIKAILITGGATPAQGNLSSRSKWPVLLKPVELEKLLATLTS